jgi:hypothetical protein
MGTWGTGLYQNDAAKDIRGDFLEELRSGKAAEAATEKLIRQNESWLEDEEEGPLFWYALADTQWEYGCLQEEVKTKALSWIERDTILELWLETGPQKAEEWKQTLAQLKSRLESEMPSKPQKVRPHRAFICPWKEGDVYAYQLFAPFSVEAGLAGKYIAFRKVSSLSWWPVHRVPITKFYGRIWDEPPTLDDIGKEKYIPANYPSICEVLTKKGLKLELKENMFHILLLANRKKHLPEEHLIYLGNVQGEDIREYESFRYRFADGESYGGAWGWPTGPYYPKVDEGFIELYHAWEQYRQEMKDDPALREFFEKYF